MSNNYACEVRYKLKTHLKNLIAVIGITAKDEQTAKSKAWVELKRTDGKSYQKVVQALRKNKLLIEVDFDYDNPISY